jgi:GNAT superfamily N-acetyltransferase
MRPAPAVPADAGEILTLQRAAFAVEAQRYRDPFMPPLVESQESVLAAVVAGEVLVLRVDGRLVGAIRRRLVDGELRIGRLVVAPDQQGRGYGALLLAAAEEVPGAQSAVLFTGSLSEANLGLYLRRGYVEFARTSDGGVELVHLRKQL